MSIFTNRIIQESYQKVYRKNRFLKPRLNVCESEVEDFDKLIYDEHDPICVKLGFRKKDRGHFYYNIEDNKVIPYQLCYKDDSMACFANKHLVWFDMETGNKTEPPKVIEGDFDCSWCEDLISLEGSPREVYGDFECEGCDNLTSLEGAPYFVSGHFDCASCYNLKTLAGAPEFIGRAFPNYGEHPSFSCRNCNNLVSLKGGPRDVRGDFECYNCKKLTSLEGIPEVSGEIISDFRKIDYMGFDELV